MIAKLITVGARAELAIARMRRALDEYFITGIKTTIPFHGAIMRNADFARRKVRHRLRGAADEVGQFRTDGNARPLARIRCARCGRPSLRNLDLGYVVPKMRLQF